MREIAERVLAEGGWLGLPKLEEDAAALARYALEAENVIRELLKLVDRHSGWCGYNEDAPGDSIINFAPDLARAFLAEHEPVAQPTERTK